MFPGGWLIKFWMVSHCNVVAEIDFKKKYFSSWGGKVLRTVALDLIRLSASGFYSIYPTDGYLSHPNKPSEGIWDIIYYIKKINILGFVPLVSSSTLFLSQTPQKAAISAGCIFYKSTAKKLLFCVILVILICSDQS